MYFLNKCGVCSPSSSVSGSVVLPACSWPSTSACGLFLATGIRPLFSHANFPLGLQMIAVMKVGRKTILIVWYTQVRKRDEDHTQCIKKMTWPFFATFCHFLNAFKKRSDLLQLLAPFYIFFRYFQYFDLDSFLIKVSKVSISYIYFPKVLKMWKSAQKKVMSSSWCITYNSSWWL